MLNLYEASYHSLEDEHILDDARDFTTKYLKESLKNIGDQHLSSLISHALDIPLHWMVPRLETKWFIEAYKKRTGMNPTLLELAKLDFNMVQAIHQEDLKYTSSKIKYCRVHFPIVLIMIAINRWWNKTTWDANPLRRILAQVIAMTTTIDDVYDVYGTLDELEQFTEAISRKAWEGLCKAYLKEAKWYNSGYTPTLEEYLENACVSISVPLMLTHISYLTSVSSTKENMPSMERIENIIRYSGIILRLADDLGTYTDEMARGDNPK
ncbi:hypothetical protein M8C21_001849, partial [Ambrosia artemisiifolia]